MFVVPETQGIKYAGSKLKLLPHILGLVADLDVRTVFDGFSGSTRVSQAFAKLGYDTTANDCAEWSRVLGTCFLLNDRPAAHYQNIIDHLNALEGYDGWFTEHYGGNTEQSPQADNPPKRPFQRHNTRKLDAIRDEIDRLHLDKVEQAVALTSLMLALDAVDSTIGHYASYLAAWSPRSYHTMRLTVPKLAVPEGRNSVAQSDIFDFVHAAQARNEFYDIAYFDPPYGSNNEKMPPSRVRYASYYHLWTSIIKHDKPPLFGKANRRSDTRDMVAASCFEEFRRDARGQSLALQALHRLIAETPARYILLSYSSGGRASKAEIMDIICSTGNVLCAMDVQYKHNVMRSMRWTNEWISASDKHHEYLFLMEKR
jgi:adenine-specific DNA-methyltransferase